VSAKGSFPVGKVAAA